MQSGLRPRRSSLLPQRCEGSLSCRLWPHKRFPSSRQVSLSSPLTLFPSSFLLLRTQGQPPSGLEGLPECLRMFQDISLGIHLPDNQLTLILRIQDIEKIFGSENRSLKHSLSLRPTCRDEKTLSPFSLLPKRGVLQLVLPRPEGLASVDQGLCPSRNTIEKNGRGTDNDISFEELWIDLRHVVQNDAIP